MVLSTANQWTHRARTRTTHTAQLNAKYSKLNRPAVGAGRGYNNFRVTLFGLTGTRTARDRHDTGAGHRGAERRREVQRGAERRGGGLPAAQRPSDTQRLSTRTRNTHTTVGILLTRALHTAAGGWAVARHVCYDGRRSARIPGELHGGWTSLPSGRGAEGQRGRGATAADQKEPKRGSRFGRWRNTDTDTERDRERQRDRGRARESNEQIVRRDWSTGDGLAPARRRSRNR